MVVTIHEELNILGQCLHSSGKTSRLACQSFQVMPQISIDRFHRVGFLFVCPHFIGSTIVQSIINRKGIAVILFGLRCPFQTSLHSFRSPLQNHIPTQNTASIAIDNGQDVDFVFFLLRKVYNSSNSAFLTLLGIGAFGSLEVY